MKYIWEVGDQVARTRGGNMVGRVVKVGKAPKAGTPGANSCANIAVEWTNGHTGKVAAHQIRPVIVSDICGRCKMTTTEHNQSPCARGILSA